MARTRYDLATAQPERIAKAVLSGAVQLEEVPMSNRRQVEREVRKLEEEEKKAEEKLEEEVKPKKKAKKNASEK